MKIILFVILAVFSYESLSCGSTAQRFMGYPYAKTLFQKTNFLKEHSCAIPINYRPREADSIIAKVLVDAIKSGVDLNLIKKTLKNFNCVYTTRELDIHLELKQLISEDKFFEICPQEQLQALFIVNASGGLSLRDGPSKQHKRIGAIANGIFVQVIKRNGDWAQVKSYDGVGYVYSPLLSAY